MELGYLEVVDDSQQLIEVQKDSGAHRIAIKRHEVLKIGRHRRDCNVIVDNPAISAVHCMVWPIVFDDESLPMFYIKDTSLNGTAINGKLLQKKVAYLLQNDDIIDFWSHLPVNISDEDGDDAEEDDREKFPVFKFRTEFEQPPYALEIFKQRKFERRIENWEVTPTIIGNGTFGHVLVCNRIQSKLVKCDNTLKRHYAVKIIKLKPNKLDKEAKILLKLDHPNIIKVYRTFVDLNDNLYIFQDLIPGGDLFSYLAKGDCLTSIPETEALLIVFQILQALKYLHDRGIVHRDLKLDNVLLTTPEPCTKIVLADFGIAKHLSSSVTRMHTVVGTPEYCAPEVGFIANRKAYQSFSRAATLEQEFVGYSNKCDLWSLGVITHIILTGISPFYGDGSEKSIIQNAKLGKLNFGVKHWSGVSLVAKDFVRCLLQVNVEQRLNSKESLAHAWLSLHREQLDKVYNTKILEMDCSQNQNQKQNQNLNNWKRKLPGKVVSTYSFQKNKNQKLNI